MGKKGALLEPGGNRDFCAHRAVEPQQPTPLAYSQCPHQFLSSGQGCHFRTQEVFGGAVPKAKGIEEIKQELCRFAKLAWERRLIAGLGGNVSARVPGEELILITASGVSLRDTAPRNLIAVNLDGELVDKASNLTPSKELGMHLAAYRLREEVKAVFHLHPPMPLPLPLGVRPSP